MSVSVEDRPSSDSLNLSPVSISSLLPVCLRSWLVDLSGNTPYVFPLQLEEQPEKCAGQFAEWCFHKGSERGSCLSFMNKGNRKSRDQESTTHFGLQIGHSPCRKVCYLNSPCLPEDTARDDCMDVTEEAGITPHSLCHRRDLFLWGPIHLPRILFFSRSPAFPSLPEAFCFLVPCTLVLQHDAPCGGICLLPFILWAKGGVFSLL